jgi:hypothetical protein
MLPKCNVNRGRTRYASECGLEASRRVIQRWLERSAFGGNALRVINGNTIDRCADGLDYELMVSARLQYLLESGGLLKRAVG